MTDKILNPRDMDFLIYEFLNTELLLNRLHYAGHSKDLFDATLKSTQLVADKYFANHYRKSDVHELQNSCDCAQVTSTIPTPELLTKKCPPHPHTHLKATLVDGGCTRDVLIPF